MKLRKLNVFLLSSLFTFGVNHFTHGAEQGHDAQKLTPLIEKILGDTGIASKNNNPIIPGYFADPSISQFEGKYYITSGIIWYAMY